MVDPDGSALTYRRTGRPGRPRGGVPGIARRGAGGPLSLILPKSVAAVTAIFGILKARAAYVPIDWTAPAARIRSILADCRTRAVFADARRSLPWQGDPLPEHAVLVGRLHRAR